MKKDKLEEASLFKEMVGEVRPLKKSLKTSDLTKKNKIKHQLLLPSLETSVNLLPLSDYYVDSLHADENVSYLATGESLSPQIIKKIRRGEYPKEQTIDLHGDSVDSAREKLSLLLQQAHEKEMRSLFIIHGKGKQAILKNHVVHWLKQVPWVLYFCSASPNEGGAGALYVLLKRKKAQNLSAVRDKIDELDNKINALLCERFKYAKKAAKQKKTLAPDFKREQEILKRMHQKAIKAGIPPERMEAIYLTLLREMKKYQDAGNN